MSVADVVERVTYPDCKAILIALCQERFKCVPSGVLKRFEIIVNPSHREIRHVDLLF
jgi:hypothetical protein